MQITLNNTGKRFNREWIFRRLSYTFVSGGTYAVTGANGSGKSTLLQVIAGAVLHNEGTIDYKTAPGIQNPESGVQNPYQHIAIAAPYLELIEEMTAKEMLLFHARFKKLTTDISEILQVVGLSKAADKQLRYFSSGMKQRLKLAQAFFSDTGILLLDEPTTNLDAAGIALYHRLIKEYTKDRLVIVSSNDRQEYDFCEEEIDIGNYKTV